MPWDVSVFCVPYTVWYGIVNDLVFKIFIAVFRFVWHFVSKSEKALVLYIRGWQPLRGMGQLAIWRISRLKKR